MDDGETSARPDEPASFRQMAHRIGVRLCWLMIAVGVGGLIWLWFRSELPEPDQVLGFIALAFMGAIFLIVVRSSAGPRGPRLFTRSASASIDITRSRQEVWEFSRTPGTGVLVSDNVLAEFQIPGTPTGPGEQHVQIVRSPSGIVAAIVQELMTEEVGVRLVAKELTGFGSEFAFEFSDAPEGTHVTLTTIAKYPWWAYSSGGRRILTMHLAATLASLKRVLESGAGWTPNEPAHKREPNPSADS